MTKAVTRGGVNATIVVGGWSLEKFSSMKVKLSVQDFHKPNKKSMKTSQQTHMGRLFNKWIKWAYVQIILISFSIHFSLIFIFFCCHFEFFTINVMLTLFVVAFVHVVVTVIIHLCRCCCFFLLRCLETPFFCVLTPPLTFDRWLCLPGDWWDLGIAGDGGNEDEGGHIRFTQDDDKRKVKMFHRRMSVSLIDFYFLHMFMVPLNFLSIADISHKFLSSFFVFALKIISKK